MLSVAGFVEIDRLRRAGTDRTRPHAALAAGRKVPDDVEADSLDVEAELDHVAVGHHVVLALDPHLAR